MNIQVTHLNTSDNHGGAARAAYRLHQEMRTQGVNSTFLVQHKQLDDRYVVRCCGPNLHLYRQYRLFCDQLPVYRYLRRDHNHYFSPAWVPSYVHRHSLFHDSQIAHFHWVTRGFFPITSMKHLTIPVVWTLHDMWAMTGGCHYDSGCNRYHTICRQCPALGSSGNHDLAFRRFRTKQRIYENSRLCVVTPSHWLARCARESALLGKHRIEVIPNGLDMAVFQPIHRHKARSILGLNPDKVYLLFGAMTATSDPRKGFIYLKESLQRLATFNHYRNVELVVFGDERAGRIPDLGMPVHHFGVIDDEQKLINLYSASDAFVAPSIEDNLPNTVMESMACGTPCIAFDVGGMGDMIHHRKNGYLASARDSDDLSRGIEWVIKPEWNNRLSREARDNAVNDFSLPIITRRYRDLYEDIMQYSPAHVY